MSKNLSRRSWAIAAAIAMGVSTFSVMPAQAAEGDVTLLPTAGSNLGAFSTDDFEMTAGILTATGVNPETLSFQITTSQDDVEITIDSATTNRNGPITKVTLRAFDATGDAIVGSTIENNITVDDALKQATGNSGDTATITQTAATTRLRFDFNFDDAKASRLVITGIQDTNSASALDENTNAVKIGVKPQKDAGAGDYTYGDGNPKDISVQAWIDLDGDVSDVESSYASPVRTVSFVDPKSVAVIPSIERFVSKGGVLHNNSPVSGDSQTLAGKLVFGQSNLNLDQVDASKWEIAVTTDSAIRGFTKAKFEKVVTDEAGRKNKDQAGALHFVLSDASEKGLNDDIDDANSLRTDRSYGVEFTHDSGTNSSDPKFNSVRFTPPANSTERETFVAVTDSDNGSQTNTEPLTNGANITLRPGTKSFTYKAELYDDNPSGKSDKDETASVLVMAVVTAKYLAEDATLSVSGSNEVISRKDQAAVVTGLTDSDGEYSVTVTSSDASALTKYELEFYTLDGISSFENVNTGASGARTFIAEYKSSSVAPASLTATNATLAGTSVTAEVTAKDTFGEVTNAVGTKPLYVTFRASDKDDLDETVEVDANGKAEITFDNYLSTGGSDLITARLHTGASYGSSTTTLQSVVMSLYNPADAAGVNVPATYTGVITYSDFITGAASSSNIAPTDASRISTTPLTGTVVDSNGSGVPGAVVTVDAPGMQLRKSDAGDYFQDSITFAADAAGGFKVDMWSHTVDTSKAGTEVTVTSGGQSATTKVNTYLPQSLDGKNLVFSMDVPATPAVNQTYAVQASLTDKWGNPVATSGDTVRFLGVGSVTINSDTKAVDKTFGKDGTATVFLRSVKDIEGPGSVTAELLSGADYTTFTTDVKKDEALTITEETTDVAATAHDETSFSNSLEVDVEVGGTPAQSADQKVNAGSFKGYVAVYAKGYEGQRLSAKIGNDWVIVDPIVNNEGANLHRTTDFTGAGVDIAVRIYIDRVLVDTINLTTK